MKFRGEGAEFAADGGRGKGVQWEYTCWRGGWSAAKHLQKKGRGICKMVSQEGGFQSVVGVRTGSFTEIPHLSFQPPFLHTQHTTYNNT
jgi:hypothetical protein